MKQEITKVNRQVDFQNLEAIVSDNDGTLYSIAKYIDQFADYVAGHWSSGATFAQEYAEKNKHLLIGQQYRGTKKQVHIKNGWWLPIAIFLGGGYGDIEDLRNIFFNDFYRDVMIPSKPDGVAHAVFANPLYKMLMTGNRNGDNVKKFLEVLMFQSILMNCIMGWI